jgi:CheY-like chemotaxis protein
VLGATERTEETVGARSRGKILVVDDSGINRLMLSRYIQQEGHSVEGAENGLRALEMLRTGAFDVVLLDIDMPEMDGYAVLERLHADTRLREIPVIMITAVDEIESVVRCIELGAQDYLPKPFNPVLLHARLDACLEKKRLRDLEIQYLEQVERLTDAAAAVETNTFEPESIAGVSARPDALGRLARVFQTMAREVRAREERLTQQVQQLRIEIDQTKKAREVAEITESDYFQDLQRKAKDLRNRGA